MSDQKQVTLPVSAPATVGEDAGSGGARVNPVRGGVPRVVRVRQGVLVGSFLLMILFFYLQEPDLFLSLRNIQNVIDGMPVLTAMAVGVTVVLMLGEFDLSVPNVAQLVVATIAVLAVTTGLPLLVIVVVGLAVGATAGLVNGVTVGYGKASAFVVTLAVGSVAYGLELVLQGRIPLGATSVLPAALPTGLTRLSSERLLGLKLADWVLLVVAVALWLMVARSPWGRHTRSIGGSEIAARLAGVAVQRTKVIAFVVAGLMAAVAGVLFSAQNGYYGQALTSFLLPAYAAAFFGAAAIGRRGFSIGATLFGALYLAVLANGLVIMNQPTWVVNVVQGVVLFVAILVARFGSSSQ